MADGTQELGSQRVRIFYEDALVAMAREQREPTAEHRAERESAQAFLEQAGGVEGLSQHDRAVAEALAQTRLGADEAVGRCLCWRCDAAQAVRGDSRRRGQR